MLLGHRLERHTKRHRVVGRAQRRAILKVDLVLADRHLVMRGFDFDPEAAVRLCWAGVRPIRIDAPVRYFGRHEGGVSHFHYGRDNALLAWMHLRLFAGFAVRLPMLVARRLTRRSNQTA